ncbi:MAG: hypothetical protein KGM17_06065 [Sphingomonadales bacterium]|nr:hypothetical protein [Sphingomonadales bacterium]
MEKKIRTELFKMTGIMLVLVGLGIYAHEFVIAGIKAKMALNLSIFALFGVAAAIGFRHVFDLKNEVIALKALQADYDPRGRVRVTHVDLAKPAVVFHPPELLGEGYRLITEELGKQSEVQLSNGTVQTLLHDIDLRISDRKSTLIYFSGLMVFLGLLGAFMGLMKTVHSVSDLIGSMDMSGKGGADSFGKMIEGMKAPLSGMSVGFSSSLFGLMTSMVLGALERCMTSAMKAMRNEFEHWVSKLAALESAGGEGATTLADDRVLRRVLEAGTAQLRELRELVAVNQGVSDSDRRRIDALHGAVKSMAEVMHEMTAAVSALADPGELLRPIAGAVDKLAAHQAEMLADIHRLHGEANADRENLRALVSVLEVTVDRLEAVDGPELHGQLDRILALHAAAADRAQVEPGPAGEPVAGAAMVPIPKGVAGWIARFWGTRRIGAALVAQRRELENLHREMREALAGNRRAVRKGTRLLARRLERMEQGRDRDRRQIETLSYLAGNQRQELAGVRRQLEAAAEDAGKMAPYTGGRAMLQQLRDRLNLGFEPQAPARPAGERPDQAESRSQRA